MSSWKNLAPSNIHAILFFSILVLAAVLRFYQLENLMPFISDQGRDFLAAKNITLTGQLPLLGIPSSVPRFSQGPLYIWMLALALKIGSLDPFAAATMAALLGLLATGVTFLLSQRFFSTKSAVYAGLIMATSPLAVAQSRLAFHTNAIPLFSAIFAFSLLNLNSKKTNLFWPAFLFSLVFQFELVAAPLLLLLPLTIYLKRIKPTKILLIQAGLGLFLGLLPQVIYDLTHNFAQLGLFAGWILYRTLGFFGANQHAASFTQTANVISATLNYAQRYFSWSLKAPTLIILIFTTFTLLTKINIKKNINLLILVCWIIIMLLAFIVLGNASEAYFPALFVPVTIIVAWALANIISILQKIATSLVLLVSLINIHFLFSNNFLVSPIHQTDTNSFGTYGSPISQQLLITSQILQLNTPINLKSTDKNATFSSYLDNFRYLIIWQDGSLDADGLPVWINNLHENKPLPYDTKTYNFPNHSLSITQNP